MQTRTRRIASLACLAALAAGAGAGCGPAGGETPPNLVLVIADDLGYPDSGFMGSPVVQTPHLDRLAAEGTLFRNGYATASICRPALRSLLTGLHPVQWSARLDQLAREGVVHPPAEAIRAFTTLPTLLASRGYASFQGGKFWEGSFALAGFDAGMVQRGDGISDGGEGRPLGRETLEPVRRFLDERGSDPFFLWFAPMLPHVPHDAPEEYLRLYRDRGLARAAAAYYANATRFDAVVGELRAELERRGLLERTLLVYLSDNGWDQPPGSEPVEALFDGPRGKRTLYDLGLRTPILLRWPGRVPAGAVRDELVSAVDLFPTLLDYAGVAPPPDLPGRSLRPLVEGRGGAVRFSVIERMTEVRGGVGVGPTEPRWNAGWSVRRGHWHYIWYEGGGEELYDLRSDPREERNLAREQRALARRLRRESRVWLKEVTAPFAATAAGAAPTAPPARPSARP